MMRFLLCLFLISLTIGCAPSAAQLTATVEQERIYLQSNVEIAIRRTTEADRATAPRLRSPFNETAFPAPPVVLEWEWIRPLRANEVYDIRVGLLDDQRVSIAYTTDSRLNLERWLRYHDGGLYSWSVQVVVIDSDGKIREMVSPESTPQSFSVLYPFALTPTASGARIQTAPEIETRFYGNIPPDVAGFNSMSAIEFGPDGYLYALTLGGDIFVFGDGRMTEPAEPVYLDMDDRLQLATGMDFFNGVLYVAEAGHIRTVTDSDSDGTLETLTTIADHFMIADDFAYANSGIAFGPDGKLYVSISATTDHGPVRSDREATILRMNPDGSDVEVFATGLRDVYDLTFSPDGHLFAVDNGPALFDEMLRYLPSGELNHIRDGHHYGFPDVFGDLLPRGLVAEAGDPPITTFYPSNMTRGLVYHPGNGELAAGVYVALFGSSTFQYERSVESDHMLVHVALEATEDGSFQGDWEPFAVFDGGYTSDYERPVDVTVGPDGALYVATWERGAVYRITLR